MILISKTTSGILVQRDELDIQIEAPAVPLALGTIISTLITSGTALATARREAYEAGLNRGYEQCAIEYTTSERIAERQASDLLDTLYPGVPHASAA